MKRNRRIKIVATLGPSSASEEKIKQLYQAGADVFRINMSHANHAGMKKTHTAIRNVEKDVGRPIAILVDLQGPKLRVGEIKDGVILKQGELFHFDRNKKTGDDTRVFLPHPEIFESIEANDRILVDDGKLLLKTIAVTKDKITMEVVTGGRLTSRKGVSLPDTLLPIGALTDKDFSDLDYALKQGVDWIALSFVQKVEDVQEARKKTKGKAAILTKIEKPQAIHALDEIIAQSDAVMVARGDLGVEMPVEQVPGLQKRITLAARKAGKPVVVATQMLESMISSPVPTRAEVSDVATAVYDAADAIMLSAESAVGDYPVVAVATMDKIAVEVEEGLEYGANANQRRSVPETTGSDAIAAAVRTVSDTLNLSAIICYTSSGSTGLRMARERPRQSILALSAVQATARKLCLCWGLHSVKTRDPEDLDNMVDKACRISIREGFAKPGQRVIITAGVPLGTPGATNMLRIAFVGKNGAAG